MKTNLKILILLFIISSLQIQVQAHDYSYIYDDAGNSFTDKTKYVNEMWQTDFTYFKVLNWGWYYLATILDDYSRYIISWKLFYSRVGWRRKRSS